MRKIKHEWQYSEAGEIYRCAYCKHTGFLLDGVKVAFGGAVKPELSTVDPVVCYVEQDEEPVAQDELPADARFGDPTAETTASPEEIFHRLLVGSDGRVAIQFTKPVEFYSMSPREAFDLAQEILQAAYTSRERQQGVIVPLGKSALDDKNFGGEKAEN